MLIGDKIPQYKIKPLKCRICGRTRICRPEISTGQPVCRECFTARLQIIGDNLLKDLDA
jgi:hypothetical protein